MNIAEAETGMRIS